MSNLMFKFIIQLSIVLAFSAAHADVKFSYLVIDKKVSVKNCLAISKQARGLIDKDDFGEYIIESSYSFVKDNLIINVMCLEEKEIVVLSVSTQDLDSLKYLNIISEHFEKILEVKHG